MDITEKIKLGENKYFNAVNEDVSLKVPISGSRKTIVEYDIANVIDINRLYNDERQATDIYRLHGEIEVFSILNNIPIDYKEITDYFEEQPVSANTKNILTDFDFYLVKPLPPKDYVLTSGNKSGGYKELVTGTLYEARYEVISELIDFEVNQLAFAKNIFNEQQYSFTFNVDIDVSNDVDGLGFPLTEIFLYAHYKIGTNGYGDVEILHRKKYDSDGGGSSFETYTETSFTKGDELKGNVVNYNNETFEQTISIDDDGNENIMEYRIRSSYGASNNKLRWIYKPFIPIKIRVFENALRRANTGSTSNDDLLATPTYAKAIDNEGNVVWRNLQDKGFIDPLTDEGIGYPFMNNRHYIFENIVLSVTPDLTHGNTEDVFEQILFDQNNLLSKKLNSNLNDIGEKCD